MWVLTGDKIETAMNIGVSAGLLDASMQQHVVDEADPRLMSDMLANIQAEISKPANKA